MWTTEGNIISIVLRQSNHINRNHTKRNHTKGTNHKEEPHKKESQKGNKNEPVKTMSHD